MNGVVSLLDDHHDRLVKDLWAELAERLNIAKPHEARYPHFSYQVAADYDLPALETTIRRFAGSMGGFKIRTAGLGIFTGPEPTLYITVVRDVALSRLHRELWPELTKSASGVVDYYHPLNWIPHITLINHGPILEHLPAILGWLGQFSFSWEIPVNNLALIHDTDTGRELKFHFEW